MSYKPQALDVDKMEKMFDGLRDFQEVRHEIKAAENEAFNRGYKEALIACRGSLDCSNYELQLPESQQNVTRTIFYKLCKELDVPGNDIYDAGSSLDEAIVYLAQRIRETLKEEPPDDT